MYTRCPQCQTVFAVAEEDLAAAQGWVRCGTCLHPFDAHRESLAQLPGEDPQAPAAIAGSLAESLTADANPPPATGGWYLVPDGEVQGGHRDGASAPAGDSVTDADATTLLPLTGSGAPEPAPADDPEDRPPPAPGEDPTPVVAEDGIPEALAEDAAALTAPRPSPARALLRGLAVVALLALLILQGALFQPQAVAFAVPPARPLLEAMAAAREVVFAALGRPQGGAYRAPERVRLVSRDVRTLPGNDRMLQVTATLVNDAPLAQPLPVVVLTLYDVTGATIATRRFLPQEYAREDGGAGRAMTPGIPFQFDLELWVPPLTPVSYSFDFR